MSAQFLFRRILTQKKIYKIEIIIFKEKIVLDIILNSNAQNI